MVVAVLLFAGSFLSLFRETVPYRDKTTGAPTTWDKVEVYALDAQGRPHTLGLSRDFDEGSLPTRGAPMIVSVRPSSFRNEVQLSIVKVLTQEEARTALGLGAGLRAAETKAG